MRKLFLSVLMTAAVVLLLSGCQKEENVSPEPDPEPDVPAAGAPVITLGQELLSFTAEEGSYELTYAVENPVDGGKVSAGSDEGWITAFNCDTDGVVTFTVSANEEQQERTARITVTYTYADGKVEAVADAVQEAAEAAEPPAGQYDYDYDLEYIAGDYYGDAVSDDSYNFFITLTDEPFEEDGYPAAGSVIYYIDLFSTLPEDENNPLPASGTYTLTDDEDFPPYTINGGMTYPSFASGTVYLDDITLEIGYEGDNIVLDAVMLDKNGESHHVTYSGPVVFSVDI